MFKIKLLPARFGDSIWIEYGEQQAPHRILIDGGTAGTRKAILHEFQKIPSDQRRLDLLVISHIDRDHIEGVLGLLDEDDPGFEVDDLWFNGYHHLPEDLDDDLSFGALQGERLSGHINRLDWPWNRAFDGKAVCIPDQGALPQFSLAGGMQITVLTPSLHALAELRPKWEDEVRAANLVPGFGLAANDDLPSGEETSFDIPVFPDVEALAGVDFEPDSSEANASSIALMAEYEGKRALLAADAHADMLLGALDRFSPGVRIPLDLYKISHHGSKFTTNREVLDKVTCSRYAFSTNGSIFKHPDQEVVSRVIAGGGNSINLIFNYQSTHNGIWDHPALKEQYGYGATFPAGHEPGIEIEI